MRMHQAVHVSPSKVNCPTPATDLDFYGQDSTFVLSTLAAMAKLHIFTTLLYHPISFVGIYKAAIML